MKGNNHHNTLKRFISHYLLSIKFFLFYLWFHWTRRISPILTWNLTFLGWWISTWHLQHSTIYQPVTFYVMSSRLYSRLLFRFVFIILSVSLLLQARCIFSISCSKSTNKIFHLTIHFHGTLSDGLWTFSYDFIFLAHYFWLESSLHAFQTDFLRTSISIGSYIRATYICVQVNRATVIRFSL